MCEITKTEFLALLKDLIIKTLIYLLVTCWPFAGNLHENALKPFLRRFYQSSSTFTLKRNKNGRKVEKRSSVGLSRRWRRAQEGSHHNKEEHSKEYHATPGKESFFTNWERKVPASSPFSGNELKKRLPFQN